MRGIWGDPNLPAGCTSRDCEGYDPECGRCGHRWSDHFDDPVMFHDEPRACNLTRGKTEAEREKNWCNCSGFIEGSYEPEYEPE